MRRYLVSAVGVACAAVIALPPTLHTAGAATAQPTGSGGPGDSPGGSTRTLALTPLRASARALGARAGEGLPARTVKPFSLLGVTWDDATQDLHGRVQVRTRAVGTGIWSPWQDIETHTDDAPDLTDAADRVPGRTRGTTVPLWVGDSDGVRVRVQPESPEPPERADRPEGPEDLSEGSQLPGRTVRVPGTAPALPAGLRLEMVDPGDDPGNDPGGSAPGGSNGALAHSEARSASTDRPDSNQSADSADWADWDDWADQPAAARLPDVPDAPDVPDVPDRQTRVQTPGTPFIGARPHIISRVRWGANESLRKGGYVYSKKVKVAFVHHTGTGNSYTCAKAPSVIRSIYRYHVKSTGWRDIAYNFLVDKCGNIYEGRAGGVTKAVLGAHTLGFNTNSMGIAVLGTYSRKNPSAAALAAISKLTAWKLGLFGANPDGSTHLTSGGSNRYKKGKKVKLRVISGHKDGFVTECPGARLYGRLGVVRDEAAELQGR